VEFIVALVDEWVSGHAGQPSFRELVNRARIREVYCNGVVNNSYEDGFSPGLER
jgi:hypothetical protein